MIQDNNNKSSAIPSPGRLGAVLIIDNYDSFTYNLVHLVNEVGLECEVWRNDKFNIEDVARFDKIILSPGPGIPSEAGLLLDVIKRYAPEKSIFGVCLGQQAIAEAFGGTLNNLSRPMHGIATPIKVTDRHEKLFEGLPEHIKVGRYHSWVVNAHDLPGELLVTAIDENNQSIMALRHKEYDVRGVQFHPESVLTEYGKEMMANWLNPSGPLKGEYKNLSFRATAMNLIPVPGMRCARRTRFVTKFTMTIKLSMNILDKIVAHKKTEVEAAKARFSYMFLEESEYFTCETHSFRDFLLDPARTGIIAEFKRKSPSKGIINDSVTVEEVTKGYNAAGASAISVLTDRNFFMGQKRDLTKARRVNSIPLLRKDFMIDEYQVVEAKAIGADIILLIAAILTPAQIKSFAALAKSLGLNVLLEVHNLEELQRSIDPNLDAIGVNNRNLADFTVSVDTSYQLAKHIPKEFLKISESAISNPQTINELKQAGFNGFLIGENFMKEANPGKAMAEFVKNL